MEGQEGLEGQGMASAFLLAFQHSYRIPLVLGSKQKDPMDWEEVGSLEIVLKTCEDHLHVTLGARHHDRAPVTLMKNGKAYQFVCWMLAQPGQLEERQNEQQISCCEAGSSKSCVAASRFNGQQRNK
jgi:hypothetical protein